MAITTDMLVDDVMRRWPTTIRVFLDFRMPCVGCPVACFHTVADAAREHDVDCGRFVVALNAGADGPCAAGARPDPIDRVQAPASRPDAMFSTHPRRPATR